MAAHLTDRPAAGQADPPVAPGERRVASGCGRLVSLAVAPDGQSFATGAVAAVEPVRLWDAGSGKLVRSLLPAGAALFDALRVTFSPDGKLLAVVGVAYPADRVFAAFRDETPTKPYETLNGSHGVWVFDVSSGRQVTLLRAQDRELVEPLVFSRDGRLIAASRVVQAYAWEVASGKLMEGDQHGADAVAFGPRNLLYAVRAGPRLVTVDLAAGKLASSVALPDGLFDRPLDTLLVSADGATATYATVTGAITVEVATGKVVGQFRLPSVGGVTFSKDGQRLVAACGSLALDAAGQTPAAFPLAMASDARLACVWDVRTGRPLKTFTGPTKAMTGAAFVDDDGAVLTTSTDGTIRQWTIGGKP